MTVCMLGFDLRYYRDREASEKKKRESTHTHTHTHTWVKKKPNMPIDPRIAAIVDLQGTELRPIRVVVL